MKPSTKVNTPLLLAFELLNGYERKPSAEKSWAKADEALSQALDANPQLSPSQKGLLTHLVYGTLRYWLELGSWVEHFTQKRLKDTPATVRTVLRIAVYQLRYLSAKDYAVVNEAVELGKKLRIPAGQLQLLNGVLRSYVRLQEETASEKGLPALPLKPHLSPIERLAKTHSIPPWLAIDFAKVFAEADLIPMFEACKLPAPLVVRVNQLKTTVANYQAKLTENNIAYSQRWEDLLPACLVIESKIGSPTKLPDFATGSVYVQDFGSAFIAHQAKVQPHQTVIDLCAAPGSKTVFLAEQLQLQGSLTAVDISARRLERLKENANRLGIPWGSGDETFLQIVVASAVDFDTPNKADVIVVDAPCSGLGTVKRHPERLLSISPEQIADYPPLQLAILKRGSQLMKPSGRLVYSTCSIHPAENRSVVEAFLASPEGEGFQLESETLLPITPLHDGFYVAVLVAGKS